jgi:hypothetical protein
MSTFATLSSGRICLRRWRDEDREAFAAMNSDARVMEFFRSRLSRVESDAMVDGIQEHFKRTRLWFMGYRGPGCSPFYRFRRIGSRSSPTIQRPFHPLCGSRLASGLRALGTRLCNGGGPVSAWLRVWDSRAPGSRIFHIGDEPPLASSDGTAWNAPRSCR